MTPASAAATTPVSRVQATKTISSRVQRPRRSGPRQNRMVEGAREHEGRPTTRSAGPRLSQMSLHGRFAPTRDEDEDHDDLRDRVRRRTRMSRSWLRVHPEPQAIHVADDEPGEERAQVAAATGRVDREVADREHGHDRDRCRLAPDAGAPIRDDEREQDPEADPERGRDPELLRGSRRRASAPRRPRR